MNQELLVSILAVATAVISAVISLWQVPSKTKADDKFIKTLRNELEPNEKKVLIDHIREIQLATIKQKQINMLQKEVAIRGPEAGVKLKQELEKLQNEIALILEKMDTLDLQEKQLVIKSVNQPSEQGQIAYLDKLIKEISSTSVLSPKE